MPPTIWLKEAHKKSQDINQNEQMKLNKIGKGVLAPKNRTATPPKKEIKVFYIYYLGSNM